MQTSYNIVEIFESLQGEGFNTGMPSVFIRFGKCNLTCPWCDTQYNRFKSMTLAEISQQVSQFKTKNIIITGGEPTLVANLTILLNHFKQQGYFLAIETNGLKPVPAEIDYIATSPKRLYREKYQQRCITFADEVRIVNDQTENTLLPTNEIFSFCQQIAQQIKAKHYYLSPCETGGKFNLLETIKLIGQLNQNPINNNTTNSPIHWQLSLQTHKLAGIE